MGCCSAARARVSKSTGQEVTEEQAKAAYQECPSCDGKKIKFTKFSDGTGTRRIRAWCKECGWEKWGI